MRKNSFFILFLFINCVRDEFNSSLYIKKSIKNSVSRNLAGEKRVRCFKDRFKEEYLQNEVDEIELLYPENKTEGENWKGLDLSSLRLSEVNFIKKFGHKIGNLKGREEDFSGCKNLICVINRIYQNKIPEAGYVHYLWFLKTNQLLSFDNLIPKQKSKNPGEFNGKQIPFENYLFSKEELNFFWVLTHLMTGPFLNSELLKEIQRVPRGEKFEESNLKEYCGLASPAGWIKLTDACLIKDHDQKNSFPYLSILHEISHQLDFYLGRKQFQSPYRSHMPDYLDVSGLYLEEFINEDGYIFREWKSKEDAHFLNPYSKVNPQENFSEVSAHYVLNSSLMKKIISEKQYSFLKDKIFSGREFSPNDEKRDWIEKRQSLILESILTEIMDCGLDDECIRDQKNKLVEKVVNHIEFEEPFACDELSFDGERENLKLNILLAINTNFEKVESLRKQNLEENLSIFEERSFKEKPGILSYLDCYKENKNCYLNLVKDKLGNDLGEIYAQIFPFEAMQTFVNGQLRIFTQPLYSELRGRTEKIWQECSKENNNFTLFIEKYHFIPSGYLDMNQLKCVNYHIENLISAQIQNIEEIEHEAEKLIFLDEILILLNGVLEEQYRSLKISERKNYKEYIQCSNNKQVFDLKYSTPEEIISLGVDINCKEN
jgi:hypothetical protein